jgi:SAM-dependent methyltransferase
MIEDPMKPVGFVTDPNRPWLGGSCKGGDPATYYPDLWNWLVDDRKVNSVIDVGCGEGIALRHFERRGCVVLGVDGIKEGNYYAIQEHDYTQSPYRPFKSTHRLYDLCWSCEFVEHVEEQFMPNFLATFACAKMVLMTHAWPNQDGYHHVNCQTPDYWKGALAGVGFQYDYTLTQIARAYAEKNTNPWNHFKRSGLVFIKNNNKKRK